MLIHRKIEYLLACLLLYGLVAILIAIPTVGADEFDKFDETSSKLEQKFNIETKETWKGYQLTTEKQFRKYQQEIERLWGEFERSTKIQWVEYDKTLKSRNKIDFKKGNIEFSTLVDPNETISDATKRLFQRIDYLFDMMEKRGQKELFLKQIRNRTGQFVPPQQLREFLKQEVSRKAKVQSLPNKKNARKYSYSLNLDENHLGERAKVFYPLIKEYASHYQIDPAFVLAVMHAESYFNPFAYSHAGAIGLMQLMPQYGGMDAYRAVFKKSIRISRLIPLLYDPEHNIALGTAYLKMLDNRLRSVSSFDKRRYMVIASYNWGINRVKKLVHKNKGVLRKEPANLFRLLVNRAPDETSKYLRKVIRLTEQYQQKIPVHS